MRVAFDVDDTIWKIQRTPEGQAIRQVPDYDLIQVLKWFYDNGDEVYVWSAGGMDHAATIVEKLGLGEMVQVIPKNSGDMDIAFDDCETNLAKVDVRVKRNKPLEYE